MSKQKSILLNGIIGILGVIALLLTFQFANINSVKAASSINFTSDKLVLNSDKTKREFTQLLYDPNTHKLADFFDINSSNDNIDAYNGENIFYWRKNNASNVINNSGSMTHTFSLSANLLKALDNGALDLIVKAEYCSQNTGDSGDKVDTVTMTIQGDDNVLCSPSNKQESFESQTYKITKSYSNYKLIFSVKADIPKFVSWSKTVMKVKEPSIHLSSSDVTAPSIGTFNVENADIWTQSKLVTFNVSDMEAGIDRIEINGEVIQTVSFNDSTQKNAQVSFTVNENNKNYNIKVYDNVGNVAETNYSSSMIDIIKPSISFGFDEGATFENLRVRFPVIIDNTLTQADEYYYYTFDGSDPKSSSTRLVLVNGDNIFNVTEEKDYTIKIYGLDSAGNEIAIERSLNVALKYYNFSISATLLGNSQNTNVISAEEHVLSDTEIICPTTDIIENGATFVFYKATINDVESTINDDKFLLKQDMVVVLYYREVVQFDFTKQNYNGTGNLLEIEFTANCPSDQIVWQILKDGQESVFATAGDYLVTASIDNDNFIGSGQANLKILNPLTVSINKTTYEYNENGFNFDITISNNTVAYDLIFIDEFNNEISKASAIANSLDAGNYTFKFNILDERYYIADLDFGTRELTGSFVVNNKLIDMPIYSNTIEYNGQNFIFENTYGYDVNVVFKLNNVETTPKDVGNYDVEIVIIQKNYEGSTTGSLVITKKDLVITAENKSSIYGENLKDLTYTAAGFVEGENYTFALTSDVVNLAGNYSILITRPNIEIVDILKNYNINYVDGNYTVEKRRVEVSVKSGQSKFFGETDPEFAYTISNLIDGDDLGLILARKTGENVGVYAINFVDNLNKNYDVVYYADNFKIVACKIIISADSKSKVYGDSDPSLTYSILYGNVIDGDDLGISLYRVAGEDVGKYEIKVLNIENTNYDVVFMSDYLYIEPKEIIISAVNCGKSYGDSDPSLTYLINDEVSEIEFLGALTRDKGEIVGEYQINLGSLYNKNFKIIQFIPATFTITKSDITITLDNVSKIYGDKDPSLTWIANKNINKDDIEVQISRQLGEDAGEYVITGDFLSSNYNITVVNGVFTILKRQAVINLTNQSKVFGKQDPKFIMNLVGVLENDRVAVSESIILQREQGENVGEYIISANSSNKNYEFIINNAIFTITKSKPILTIADATFVYDGTAKTIEAILNTEGELTYKISMNGETIQEAKNAGEYKIEVNFAGNQNYLSASAEAKLVILKADIDVVIYKDIFVMKKDGSIHEPEIGCALKSTEYQIIFDDQENAGKVGKHNYTIKFNNENINTIRGTVQILPIPTNSTTGGSVEFVDGNVDDENIDLSIEKIDDINNAKNATDMVVDSTYEIKYNQGSNAKVKVELDYDAKDYTNVFVYVYNDKGEAKLLPYQVIDGKIVFSIDADNVKLAIVRQVAGISIVTIGILLIMCGLIVVSVVKNRKKKKMKMLLRVS